MIKKHAAMKGSIKMKNTYTYNISVSVDTKDSVSSVSWKETFSRDHVKGFFSPKENSYYDLLYLPELFTPEEAVDFTPEDIAEIERRAQEEINKFQFEVILNDCLDIWLHDLKDEFLNKASMLSSDSVSIYRDKYNSAINNGDKTEAVRSLYYLIEDMRACIQG